MFLVSHVLSLLGRLAGPQRDFRLELWRRERWRNFEPEYYLLDHLTDPAKISIDVGANEGFYAGKLAGLSREVHCFEPIPWMAAALRRKLPDNVTMHEAAVSDSDGVAELRIPYAGGVQMHGTSTIAGDNPLEGATHTELVSCRRVALDSVFDRPVGFIKIDVEGHELAVLQGARRIIERDRPVLLIESEARHAQGAPGTIIDFLTARGYAGLFLCDGQLRSLDRFTVQSHQNAANISGVRKTGLYINNFIFVPA